MNICQKAGALLGGLLAHPGASQRLPDADQRPAPPDLPPAASHRHRLVSGGDGARVVCSAANPGGCEQDGGVIKTTSLWEVSHA
jgi:hypothetical protein